MGLNTLLNRPVLSANWGWRQTAIAAVMPVVAIISAPSPAAAFSFSSIYALGDSLTDTGNVFTVTNGLFPPPSLYPSNGRFSNGPVWVEYLAPKLGTTVQSLAFGGARSDDSNNFPGFPGLTQQVNAISLADPNALYILWAGANDYLNQGQTNPAPVVANVSNAVLDLAAKGAKNIAVANLPNLGALPGTAADPFAPALNQLTLAHNTGLAQSLAAIAQTQPTLSLYTLDFNTLFSNAIANPSQFGFTDVTSACLLTGCTTPETYLFWDNVHPTTAGHEEIADFAFASLQSQAVPTPAATAGLVLAGIGILGVRQWRKQRQSVSLQAIAPDRD